jgi:acetylornithine deacetylase/succinyl-diaminopimelate desuccinylase-like protein
MSSPRLHATHAEITRRGAASLDALRRYIRVPSFSDTGEGMAEAAEYTRDLLATIATDAAVVPTDGFPVVFGTVPATRRNAPSLIIYGLYDVTPTIAHEWTVDPLAAEIVDAKDIGVLPQLGAVLVGRGVHNHKGPVLSTILAVRALLDSGGELPVNLLYVIEGEEELGSPSLPGFAARHRDLLTPAAGVWLPCMQQSSGGAMTLFRAYKGLLQAELECRGGEWGGPRDGRHLWSGHAAWIDAPLMQLVHGLATLYDKQQRPAIDGLPAFPWPAVAPDHPRVLEIAQAFREHPEWEREMLDSLHVGRLIGGQGLAEHVAHYMLGTTLNVQGIAGGYQGPTFYNHMPGNARAKLDIRFPPGPQPEEVGELVLAHLERRGYQGFTLEQQRGYAGSVPVPAEADTLMDAAVQLATRYGVPVDIWPIGNNCSPGPVLTTLGTPIPYSFAGLGHGDRPHAPDEYITLGSVEQMMHWTVDFLDMWAAVLAAQGTIE